MIGFMFSVVCFSSPRTWRVQTKMSALVVQICTHILDLELFSILDKIQKACLFYCNGSFCRSCYYHLHSFKHIVYGYGASPNDWRIQKCTYCRKFGEFLNACYLPIVLLFGCHDSPFFFLSDGYVATYPYPEFTMWIIEQSQVSGDTILK